MSSDRQSAPGNLKREANANLTAEKETIEEGKFTPLGEPREAASRTTGHSTMHADPTAHQINSILNQ